MLRKSRKTVYNVIDISRYIVNYSNKKDYGITNLKLQKLLYFVQAKFVFSKKGTPCFKEKLEAWGCGVVVPVSYYEFSHHGNCNIPEIETFLTFPDRKNTWKFERVKFDDSFLSRKDKKLINSVVDLLSEYSALDLLNITLNQAPFKDSYAKGKGTEIPLKALQNYFC